MGCHLTTTITSSLRRTSCCKPMCAQTEGTNEGAKEGTVRQGAGTDKPDDAEAPADEHVFEVSLRGGQPRGCGLRGRPRDKHRRQRIE